MKSMSGSEFVKSLSRKKTKSDDLYVVAMAKAAEDDQDSLMLGPTHKCGPWTKIPLSAVARVVPVGNCGCQKHEHPLVAVYFKEKGDPTALALGKLLHSLQNELFATMARSSRGFSPVTGLRVGGGFGETDPEPERECVIIWTVVCWERDFSGDRPLPAARPGDIICVLVPVAVCWPT